MKLEDQVVSLDLAKKLKELGVKQESLFFWSSIEGKGIFFSDKATWPSAYSAFTAAELGEILPIEIKGHPLVIRHQAFKEGVAWTINYVYPIGLTAWLYKYADTEADARAKMLIYLIEQKLIEVPK